MLRVAMDDTLTITPVLRFTIAGSTARQAQSVGNSERRISFSISSSA